MSDALRALPSVDRLARELGDPAETTTVARAVLADRRAELLAGEGTSDADLGARGRERLRPSLRRVLNATGVVVHTNLGRAPLADAVADAVAEAARGYVNLELDLGTGGRGGRHRHVGRLVAELTGAEDALVVNNGAAAALLAAAALAGPGRSIVVSRGHLVEIGGGFRVPEVIEQAGARLVEVGTTNRTRRADYERALAGGADVVMRVHPSNFRTLGFVEEVAIEDLCSLGVPVIDDVGSGNLAEDLVALADEPPVRRSIAAGAAITCFSADKLLGGPQAGILAGTHAAVEACRRHPLARALRVGRLPMAALEATLALYRDPARARREVPVLAMLTADDATLRARATALATAIGAQAQVVEAVAKVGGGTLPLLELPGPAVAVTARAPDALAARLRAGRPAVIGRINEGRLLLDPRTLTDVDATDVVAAVRAALEG